MNKEDFIKLNLKNITCKFCGRTLNTSCFAYRSVYKDLTGQCRSCNWIKNNESKIQLLEKKYDRNVIIKIIRYIFECDLPILNEIANKENVSINNILEIVESLKIGNKKYIINAFCDVCGAEIQYSPSAYKKAKNHYCSHECYYKNRPNTSLSGENSVYYNRIATNCTNCNKPIKITPYRYSLKNRFGDNHNFCCKECYLEYRSKYYIAEKSSKDLIDWHSPELLFKMRMNLLKRLSSENRLNTKPQLIVNNILDELNIEYIREHCITYYSIDNYLPKYNLMIEVMGDYWHANPLKYNVDKYGLNDKQLEGIHRDKLKYSYVKNHYNLEILYLWESDIISDINLCQKIIEEWINNKGILPNYNSFNFSFDLNNNLVLNTNIIIPYKDQQLSEYKFLCNKKIS